MPASSHATIQAFRVGCRAVAAAGLLFPAVMRSGATERFFFPERP